MLILIDIEKEDFVEMKLIDHCGHMKQKIYFEMEMSPWIPILTVKIWISIMKKNYTIEMIVLKEILRKVLSVPHQNSNIEKVGPVQEEIGNGKRKENYWI